jgi:alpha-L-rhamnosidase
MIQRAVCGLFVAAACCAAVRPYGLECEARRNPVGIDAARPRLGWQLRSEEKNQRQVAYQILAATDRARLAPGQADLWDSGRVESEETSWIPYAGSELKPFQRAWWKVRVWDAAGTPSDWSEAAEWTTALLDPFEARGAWISHPDHSLRSGPLPLFRKEFAIDKPLRRALILVSGMGFHELRINGEKVGDHQLAPAWTNFHATVLYETFDVTTRLKPGANAIGVLLGNGFYNVAGGRYVKYSGSFGHPRLFVQLHLEFQDGTTREVSTDGTWKVQEGPIVFSCIYGGEDYDARREIDGWDRPGYDDSGWRRVTTVEAPGGVLRAQSSPPVRVIETFRPVRITEPKPGVLVYDLGQNFAGWPKITVSGTAGSQVRLIPGELLDSSGLVTQRSSGGPSYFTYILRGGAKETWSPRFSYYGFRYVQVEGVRPQELEGEFLHLDAPRTGRFESSNELFNRIHKLIDAAVRSNLQHVLTDCPHREKLGWLEQSYLMGPSLLYNWDLRTFLPKIIRDMREAQTVDGLAPDIAPEYVVFGKGFRDSPEWGSASVLVPWLAWEWYGDRATLESAFGMMRSYVDYLGSRAKDGLLSYGLGDWYDIGPKGPGYSQLTPQGVTATATWWRDLRVLGRAAGLLGMQDTFSPEAARVLDRFNREFYRAGANTYATGSQTALAMPLALGLAPEAARPGLVEKLVADIRSRGNHTSAGDIGYSYVVNALLQAGRSDVLFDMASEKSAPSYAAQLAAGATSLTEAWDANPHSSQNHLMLGHIEQWFYAGLAGIRIDPDSAGLRHLFIRPEPVGDVKWVKASLDTFRGPVSVNWRRDGSSFRLEVTIPPGMTADVGAPGGAPVRIGSGTYSTVTRIASR